MFSQNGKQKPTAQNRRATGESNCFWSANPITKPSTKQAITLIVKVPKGKLALWNALTHLPSINLTKLPKPPPIKT